MPIDASHRRSWIPAALVCGAGYLLIGRLFALPTEHVPAWRVAAWLASGCVYAAHIGYEHFRLHSRPRPSAWHVAAAVAIGAFALAVAGMINAQATTSTIRPAWILALVAWPAFTAVPAFLGALAASAILRRLRRNTGAARSDGGADRIG